jgi:hypothetical protein
MYDMPVRMINRTARANFKEETQAITTSEGTGPWLAPTTEGQAAAPF